MMIEAMKEWSRSRVAPFSDIPPFMENYIQLEGRAFSEAEGFLNMDMPPFSDTKY